jgi:hypothetical protein
MYLFARGEKLGLARSHRALDRLTGCDEDAAPLAAHTAAEARRMSGHWVLAPHLIREGAKGPARVAADHDRR